MNTSPQSMTYRTARIIACLAVLTMLFSACKGVPPQVKQGDLVYNAAIQTLTAMPPVTQANEVDTPTPAVETAATLNPTETLAPTATQLPPSPTPIAVRSGPTNFPANVNPLTGLPV